MIRSIRVKWLGVLVPVLGVVSASGCSGDEFCADSKTCPLDSGGTSGSAGNDGKGGAPDTNEAGATNGGSVTDNGAAGAQTAIGGDGEGGTPSTVGNPCKSDAECDDKDSCTGIEKCVDGSCAAGEAVKCPAGLVCSAKQDNACVFKTDAPWIVYKADAETAAVEAFAIKSDLVGSMDPVKISPPLAAGWQVDAFLPVWSPDGSGVVFNVRNAQLKKADSFLVRFADGLPAAPVSLTEGMSASVLTTPQWSPSGKSLMIERDDGLHWVQVGADGKVSQELASGSGYTVSQAWIKNDSAFVFHGKNISSKEGFYLAERGASSWSQKLIAEVASVGIAEPTPDGSLLGYLVIDPQTPTETLWVVETLAASKPTMIAGQAANLNFAAAPDATHFLLASTSSATGKTNISAGARADLFALPSRKANLSLRADQILPLFPGTPWAPDSSLAVAFQDDPIGRQLVVYQPKENDVWHPLPLKQLKTDPFPQWSPDSGAFALPTKTALDSSIQLTIVSAASYESRNLDETVNGGFIKMFGFSAGGELFAYAKGTGGPATDGHYIDLRQGIAKAPAPLPISDPLEHLEFATHGTGALYARAGKTDCYYVDLASASPTAAAVNQGKDVVSCSFQKLPK